MNQKHGKPSSEIPLADYPRSAMEDAGAIHILPDGSVYLENCRGIQSMSETRMVFRMKQLTVTVEGSDLSVGSFGARGASLLGRVLLISLQRGPAHD